MTTEVAQKLERYSLDASASKFTAQAFAEGLLSAFGHDPVIGINDFSGEASFVADTFESASVKLTIKADSLAVVENVKDKDRHDLERMMRDEVLEIGKFPEIVFESNNITLSKAGTDRYRARVIGDLNLHGVRQSNIWISGEVVIGGEGLRAKGEFAIKQTDFKIKLVSIAGGTLKIKNEVKCKFDIVARPVQ